MATTTTKLIIAAALLATAGCAKKRPPVLPPEPVGTQQTAPTTGEQTGPVQTSIVPGSREDFMRSVTSDTVHFALDAYDIDTESRAILDSQAAWLQKFPNVRISIEGHCDERGTREYNLALGERRANAARQYLVAQGVPAQRVKTISYGKERPLALGSNEASYAQNRRAITVTLQ